MKKRLLGVVLLGALLVSLPMAGSASTLSIFLSGLNLNYDGYTISSQYAGNANYPGADMLFSAQFVVDEVLVGTSTAAYADVVIAGVSGLSASGNPTVWSTGGAGHGFDLYFDDLGGSLDLDWDSPVGVNVNNISGNLSVFGSAVTSDIQGQSLPFGLGLGTPVEVTFSQQITSFEVGFPGAGAPLRGLGGAGPNLVNDPYISSFQSFGTGEVTGPNVVPEPGTLLLLGAGLAGGIAARRRRRD